MTAQRLLCLVFAAMTLLLAGCGTEDFQQARDRVEQRFAERVADARRELAGSWAHSVFEAGQLEPGDLEEATNAALAVGDVDVGNERHHGTPDERATRCWSAIASAGRRGRGKLAL